MKKLQLFSLLAILMFLSSCELVEGIFKAGVWVGVLIVVGIIGLLLLIIRKLF